jgi:hypothetical protein
MDRFDDERHPRGLAVEGVAATLGALAQRRVNTLFVVDDPETSESPGSAPTHCAPRHPVTHGERLRGRRPAGSLTSRYAPRC